MRSPTADVNGDGRLDAVVDGYNPGVFGGDSVIAVLRGRANGSLGPAHELPDDRVGPAQRDRDRDFDEDGSPDAVAGRPVRRDRSRSASTTAMATSCRRVSLTSRIWPRRLRASPTSTLTNT